MIVPGSNLLALAMGVIGQQAIAWARNTGLTTLASGAQVPTWADPVTIYGSLQPVDNTLLQQLGLDWTKNYCTFYAPAEFREVDRDQTGDRLTYAGKTYQVLNKTSWFAQDGWERVMCVEVPNA